MQGYLELSSCMWQTISYAKKPYYPKTSEENNITRMNCPAIPNPLL